MRASLLRTRAAHALSSTKLSTSTASLSALRTASVTCHRQSPVQTASSSESYQLFARPQSVPLLPPHLTRSISRSTVMPKASHHTGSEKKVLVPVANGTEEMEAVIVIDVLRRAGAEVVVASIEPSLEVACSRGVKLVADKLIKDVVAESFDLIACPGGMPGAERLRDSAELNALVAAQAAAGAHDKAKLLAAICATPYVFFETKGLLKGKVATAHPGFSDKLSDQSHVSKRVVVDGTLTTSRGPGTAFEFALSLVKQLYGEDKAKAVAAPMVMYDYHHAAV